MINVAGVSSGVTVIVQAPTLRLTKPPTGELACGNLRNRHDILYFLSRLPSASVATNDEVLIFIETRKLSGRGIGLIDAHLLASTTLGQTVRLWTSDRVLGEIAARFGLDYTEEAKPGSPF